MSDVTTRGIVVIAESTCSFVTKEMCVCVCVCVCVHVCVCVRACVCVCDTDWKCMGSECMSVLSWQYGKKDPVFSLKALGTYCNTGEETSHTAQYRGEPSKLKWGDQGDQNFVSLTTPTWEPTIHAHANKKCILHSSCSYIVWIKKVWGGGGGGAPAGHHCHTCTLLERLSTSS